MKKSWIITGITVILLLFLGITFYMRPSPQDQLIGGIYARNLDTMQTAMNRGADSTLAVEIGNTFNITPGYTPFQMYLMDGSPTPEGLKILLQKADLAAVSNTATMIAPDSRNGFLATPLQYLVHKSNRSPRRNANEAGMLKLILERGGPINAPAGYPIGLTALMVAEREWIIKPLLEAGADPNTVIKDGACLMNYHGQEPTHPLWKLLKKHGGRPRQVPDSPRFPRIIWGTDPTSIRGWKYNKS